MLFQFFTTDIMFDLAFGGHGPQLMRTGKDTAGMFEAMTSYLKIIATVGNVPALAPLLKALPPDPKVEKFVQLSDQCYEARAQDPSPSPDIFQYLVSFQNLRSLDAHPGHKVADVSPARTSKNDKQLLDAARSDTALLIVAGRAISSLSNSHISLIPIGSDTTSTVLTVLLFFLLTEAGLTSLRKLRSEIDKAHHDKEDLDWNEIGQRVPFLDCCINEAMR